MSATRLVSGRLSLTWPGMRSDTLSDKHGTLTRSFPCSSNACKFTPTGGKLTIKTKLVIPEWLAKKEEGEEEEEEEADEEAGRHSDERRPSPQATHSNGSAGSDFHHTLSQSHLTQHNTLHSKPAPPLEWIVVRIEVTDTGCGIRPKDIVQSKLFCEYCCMYMPIWCGMLTRPCRSCLQPDRARTITRREGYRTWTRPRSADREAQWWASWCTVQGRRGIHVLGRNTYVPQDPCFALVSLHFLQHSASAIRRSRHSTHRRISTRKSSGVLGRLGKLVTRILGTGSWHGEPTLIVPVQPVVLLIGAA